MIYFCVKFQKDPLFGVNLTFFAPWLSWQGPAFLNFFNLAAPYCDRFGLLWRPI
jgi:hypothetical protein